MKKRIRDRPLKFFVNANEERMIEEKMQIAGIKNKSAYLRKMSIDGYVIQQDFDTMRKVIYELNKIGVNINQIAKNINTYGADAILPSEIARVRKELNKLCRSLILKE